jgi:hypothetical protein
MANTLMRFNVRNGFMSGLGYLSPNNPTPYHDSYSFIINNIDKEIGCIFFPFPELHPDSGPLSAFDPVMGNANADMRISNADLWTVQL